MQRWCGDPFDRILKQDAHTIGASFADQTVGCFDAEAARYFLADCLALSLEMQPDGRLDWGGELYPLGR